MSETYQAGVTITRHRNNGMAIKEHEILNVSIAGDTELDALNDLRDIIEHRIARAEDRLRVWGMDKQLRVMKLLDAVTPNSVSPAGLIDRALQHPEFIHQQTETDEHVADWIREEFIIKPEREARDQQRALVMGGRRTSTVYGSQNLGAQQNQLETSPINPAWVPPDEEIVAHPDENEWADRQASTMPAEQH